MTSKCLFCSEPVTPAEKELGRQSNLLTEGGVEKVWVHRECQLRQVVGDISHQQRKCICFGGTQEHEASTAKTARQEAIDAVEYFEKHSGQRLVTRLSDSL